MRIDQGWNAMFEADDRLPFTDADIADVIGASVVYGDYAETDIVVLVRLNDGRYAQASAWCDTTGWDCRSGASGSIHDTQEQAWAAIGDEGRDRLEGMA